MITTITLPPLEAISLKDGMNVLGVQPRDLYFRIVKSFYTPNNDFLNLYDGNKLIPLDKGVVFIGNVIDNINLDEIYKKIAISKLIGLIDEEDRKELYSEFTSMSNSVERIVFDSFLPLTVSAEFDPKAIVGLFKPTMYIEEYTTVYDRIQGIINVAGALCESRMLVMLDIFEYCSDEQVKYLAEDIKRQNLQVICLERTDHRLGFDKERSRFIDEDFVQFT